MTYMRITGDMYHKHVLYKVTNADGLVIDIGIAQFRQLTDKLYITGWLSIIAAERDPLRLAYKAAELFPNMKERVEELMIQASKPNQTGIRCIETGETFPTMVAACKEHDLTYSALQKHMKGEKGYTAVKGKTYERILREDDNRR